MKTSKRCTILMTGVTGYLGSHVVQRLASDKSIQLIGIKRSTSSLHRLQKVFQEIHRDETRQEKKIEESETEDITSLEKNPQILFYNCDQGHSDLMQKIFKTHPIDLVFHCATNYGRNQVPRSEILEANLLLPLRLLDLAIQHRCQAFINTDTMLDKKISSYSLSKSQFLDWLKNSRDQIHCVNVSLEHFFGPLDDRTKFVSYIIKNLLEGVEEIPLTQGEQKRDFIYVHDVVSALERILLSLGNSPHIRKGFQHYEIGSGQSISIRDFILLAQKITGNSKTRLNFGALPYRPNEIMEVHVNLEKIKELGWSPSCTLEKALKEVVLQEKNEMDRERQKEK